jgi:hypothetical protein
MENLNGCQIPCLPLISEGKAEFEPQPLVKRFKRALAKLWNYFVKKYIKRMIIQIRNWYSRVRRTELSTVVKEKSELMGLKSGDLVRVRSLEEIQATLGAFKELKGCAFLEEMKQYCGSQQKVLKAMERFLDERDYQVKKTSGIVLLEGVYCQGTPVFGRCDRSCLLFWREEWLERLTGPSSINS